MVAYHESSALVPLTRDHRVGEQKNRRRAGAAGGRNYVMNRCFHAGWGWAGLGEKHLSGFDGRYRKFDCGYVPATRVPLPPAPNAPDAAVQRIPYLPCE